MNTHTPELISASLDHPWVETDVWGPGWKGWDPQRSISDNLSRRRVKPADAGVMKRSEVLADGEGGQDVELVEDEREAVTTPTSGVGCGFYDLVWTISDIFQVRDPLVDNPGCGTLFAQ